MVEVEEGNVFLVRVAVWVTGPVVASGDASSKEGVAYAREGLELGPGLVVVRRKPL